MKEYSIILQKKIQYSAQAEARRHNKARIRKK